MTVAGTGVRFVDIDEDSIERFGQWPWPRTLVAGLIDRAHAMGAKAMVFDIVFSNPTAPRPRRWAIAGRTAPPTTRRAPS